MCATEENAIRTLEVRSPRSSRLPPEDARATPIAPSHGASTRIPSAAPAPPPDQPYVPISAAPRPAAPIRRSALGVRRWQPGVQRPHRRLHRQPEHDQSRRHHLRRVTCPGGAAASSPGRCCRPGRHHTGRAASPPSRARCRARKCSPRPAGGLPAQPRGRLPAAAGRPPTARPRTTSGSARPSKATKTAAGQARLKVASAPPSTASTQATSRATVPGSGAPAAGARHHQQWSSASASQWDRDPVQPEVQAQAELPAPGGPAPSRPPRAGGRARGQAATASAG